MYYDEMGDSVRELGEQIARLFDKEAEALNLIAELMGSGNVSPSSLETILLSFNEISAQRAKLQDTLLSIGAE